MNIIKYMLYSGLLAVACNGHAMHNPNKNNLETEIQNRFLEIMQDFNDQVNQEALLIVNNEQRNAFLNSAYSPAVYDELKKEAKLQVAASTLAPKPQATKPLHPSPEKPSKTLPIKKRRIRSPGNTPPPKRKLFTSSLSTHDED